MRKKIIIGIAASLFAVAGLFGVNTMNQNANSDISLSSIVVMAEAQAEIAPCTVVACPYNPKEMCYIDQWWVYYSPILYNCP